MRNIADGLNQSTGDNNDLLRVLTCESVTQYLAANKTEDVDFVVFCVNQNRFEALTEVMKDNFYLVNTSFVTVNVHLSSHSCSIQIERSILKLDQTFLLDRICLICDNQQPSGSMMPNILHVKHKYQLHVLWGNLDVS